MPPTLFQKLFNKRSALSSPPPPRCSREDPAFSWPLPQLEPTQIRLIVYQDCERRGRNILFDSSVKKKSTEDTPIVGSDGRAKVFGKCCQLRPTGGSSSSLDSSSSCTSDSREQGLRCQGSRCSSDVAMLGEMMFGSVAMSYKGSTLKIHQIRSPPQLMLSKVFTARTGGSVYGSLNTLQDSLEFIGQESGGTLRPEHSSGAQSLLGNIGHSHPMDMPGRGLHDERDSGIARSASLSSLLITPFPSPSSSLTSSCASSYQRRWLRSQTTSLENGVFPRWSVEESFNMSDESGGPSLGVGRKKKIAIGVIFTLSTEPEENSRFQDFFFSHFPLFESHMNKLKGAIEQAMKMSRKSADASQRAQAYSRMVDSLNEFRRTICDLYTMPRVVQPVWLTMMSGASEKNQLCGHFMRELSLLMEQATKNQFLPALLTAVLTNHLAWVPTVMPNGQPPIKIFLEKHSSQSVDLLAKTHPYNPLWAQLGDLYGSIGSPVRLSRTVVVGRRQELVQRLLYVLTYFIRCSELLETHLLDSAEDEAIVMPGSLITTSLRKGEVEESDYVLVTVHKPSGDYLSQGAERQEQTTAAHGEEGGGSSSLRSGNSLQSSTYTDTEADPEAVDMPREVEEEEDVKMEDKEVVEGEEREEEDEEGSSMSLRSKTSVIQTAPGLVQNPPALRFQVSEDSEEPQQEACSCSTSSSSTVAAAIEATPPDQSHLNPGPPQLPSSAPTEALAGPPRTLGFSLEKKPPDKTLGVGAEVNLATTMEEEQQQHGEEELVTKVTFLIGDSMSPESDTESRRRRMEEQIKKHKKLLGDVHLLHPQHPQADQEQQQQKKAASRLSLHGATEDQSRPNRADSALQRVSSRMPSWSSGCMGDLTTYFGPDCHHGHHPSGNGSTEDQAQQPLDSLHQDLLDPVETTPPIEVRGHSSSSSKASVPRGSGPFNTDQRCGCSSADLCNSCSFRSCSAEQDHGLLLLHAKSQKVKTTGGTATTNDWEIPRNESSDSALGDSETEDGEDWQEELMVPFPGSKLVENYSKPSVANFGRSLFGGYCPAYVPDFVLHGIPSDDKLRQNLATELNHAVQHPVLDEPIAEAVCIIADTDRWTVQLASSQRKATEAGRLGKEVLVSSMVSSLLQSTQQLLKLNLSPNFCVMHLEDRLQEIYFKSKMLAEYLKGQTRVHVKELGMVLGIESSDLPLLAAVASTHSPYVAQILL